MRNLKIKNIIKLWIKGHRSKKYIKIISNRDKAELTIETAIVFTIIMILICSMLYFSLYLHDKTAIKSYVYSGLVEGADKNTSECKEAVYNKTKKTPVFIVRPTVSVSEDFNKYYCNVSEKKHSTMHFVDKLFTLITGNQKVEVVKKMPIDKMYLFKSIKDGINK